VTNLRATLTAVGRRLDALAGLGQRRCPASHASETLVQVWMWALCWEPCRCVREESHKGQHRNALGERWRAKTKEQQDV